MVTTLLNPWDVQETDFPASGTPAEKLCFLLNYAVLAPSGHNSQPWVFKIDDDIVERQAARDRQIAAGSPVLAVLGTNLDTAYDWLIAGQAFSRS